MSLALQIHKVECPNCTKEFYVELPEQSGVEETECVECEQEFTRTYSFTHTKGGIEVEVDITNE